MLDSSPSFLLFLPWKAGPVPVHGSWCLLAFWPVEPHTLPWSSPLGTAGLRGATVLGDPGSQPQMAPG